MQRPPDHDRQNEMHPFRMGDLMIDLDARLIRSGDGAETLLSVRECELLRALISSRGRILSYAILAHEAWHEPDHMCLLGSIRHCICRLRQKLGPAAGAIQTVRNVGYRFRRPTPDASDTTSGRSAA